MSNPMDKNKILATLHSYEEVLDIAKKVALKYTRDLNIEVESVKIFGFGQEEVIFQVKHSASCRVKGPILGFPTHLLWGPSYD